MFGARLVLALSGLAAIGIAAGVSARTTHPQALATDRTGKVVLLNAWTGSTEPYPAPTIAAAHPRFSPDGTQVVFTKKVRVAAYQGLREYAYELWVARWDGSKARRLSKYGDDPTWSPDGRTIAFSWAGPDPALGAHGRAPAGIYLIPSRGGAPHRVLSTVVGQDAISQGSSPEPMAPYGLMWSPDGRWIAFEAGNANVWVAHPDGSGARPLAKAHSGRYGRYGACPAWFMYTGPQWLADGRVAFTASLGCTDDTPHHAWAVLAIRPDGSHLTRILGPPLRPPPNDRDTGVVLTSVAPDGVSLEYYDNDHDRGRAMLHLKGRAAQPNPPHLIAWRPR